MVKKLNTPNPLGALFAAAAEQTKLPALFTDSEDLVVQILSQAKLAMFIDDFDKKRSKEDPVNPKSLFYVRGVESEWRYAHTKKGRVRTAEKAQTDYYMSVALQDEQSIKIQFTTSQYAWVSKKLMGFERGTTELVVRSAQDLSLEATNTEKFIQHVAGFLSHHSQILRNKAQRQSASLAHQEAFKPSAL